MTAGTSISTLPTFPISGDHLVNELIEIPVWKASTSYQVGDLIKPTRDFGYYMECTVAGTSGTTEPTWSTWASVKDNTITWVPRKPITWKHLAYKAQFRPYGSISG